MKKIRVGGVPEHFNFAWHIALKDKLFENSGIDLQWIDCPGGTGEMTQSLKNNKIDLAVVLTEGIVKSISDGNQFKIIQTFVKSPLIWGIHVSSKSNFNKINLGRSRLISANDVKNYKEFTFEGIVMSYNHHLAHEHAETNV